MRETWPLQPALPMRQFNLVMVAIEQHSHDVVWVVKFTYTNIMEMQNTLVQNTIIF